MDPVTMMVASIGMQFFTQHATSKKSAEIQEKQREFQKAAAEHDFERMRKLQAESARLALELEAEVHKERVEDINNNYDALLENFAHSFAIQNWPLNVLPFVMKGESFGSLFNGTTQSVNMHCILTPSNCEWFNAMFYDDIDLRLEAELNNNWNAQTTHPVVYYGGGWNRRTMRHGISVPDEINLVDIDLLKVKLKNIPVVVITPYFDHDSSLDTGSWLQFRVQIWGMGKDSDTPFRIKIPHGEIEYSKRIFSYDYNKDVKDKISNDFINTTIEEFVPYLESMIGFLADKYFWSMYSVKPKLPLLLNENKSLVKTKNLVSKRYHELFDTTLSNDLLITDKKKLISLYSSIKHLIESNEQNQYLQKVLDFVAQKYGYHKFTKSDSFKNLFSIEEKEFIEQLTAEIPNGELQYFFNNILEKFQSQIPCIFVEDEIITFLDILDYSKELMNSAIKRDIKINIEESTIMIGILNDDGETIIYDSKSPKCLVIYYKDLYINDRLQLKSPKIIIKARDFESMYNQIKKLY